MTGRKIPLRKCIGCGEMKQKKELIRIVRSAAGEVSVDLTGKASGRGAYICPLSDCLKPARKAKRLENALSCKIPDSVFDMLEEKLSGLESGNG